MRRWMTFLIAATLLGGLALNPVAGAMGNQKSMTKTVDGLSLKLTHPQILKMGPTTLTLKIMDPKSGKMRSDLRFSAEFYMSDGMASPVKVTPNKDGSYKLEAKLMMGGEWKLRLHQTKPAKKKIEAFSLLVK